MEEEIIFFLSELPFVVQSGSDDLIIVDKVFVCIFVQRQILSQLINNLIECFQIKINIQGKNHLADCRGREHKFWCCENFGSGPPQEACVFGQDTLP